MSFFQKPQLKHSVNFDPHAEEAREAHGYFSASLLKAVTPAYTRDYVTNADLEAYFIGPLSVVMNEFDRDCETTKATYDRLKASAADTARQVAVDYTNVDSSSGQSRDHIDISRESISRGIALTNRFASMSSKELQEYFVRSLLKFYDTMASNVKSAWPFSVIDRSIHPHFINGKIALGLFPNAVDVFRSACLVHMQGKVADEVGLRGIGKFDGLIVRDHYPALEAVEALGRVLSELYESEDQMLDSGEVADRDRPTYKSLLHLSDRVRGYQERVGWAIHNRGGELPDSPSMVDLKRFVRLVKEPAAGLSFFRGTLAYLVVASVVEDARQARSPLYAASTYAQAAVAGLGLPLIRESVSQSLANDLCSVFGLLAFDPDDAINNKSVASKFRDAHLQLLKWPKERIPDIDVI